MTEVSRLTESADTPEGFRVTTEAQGHTYEYDLRVVEEREDADDTGTVELAARRVDGVADSGETTEAVREAMQARGFEVME